MPGVRYIINIVKTDKGGRRVRPGRLTVEGGDWVEWRNNLDEPALLTFNRGNEVFNGFPEKGAKCTIEIQPNDGRCYQVLDRPLHGEHPYLVLGKNSRAYHSGDSDPRIDVL